MNRPPIETDALVIGAGPVGLFQVFQLGLLGIQSHVVDSLPYAGGQCIELYPDKPIYDIPGTPRCTGRELTASLLQQVAPFAPPLHLSQVVTTMAKQPDGRFELQTSRGTTFIAKTIFIAAGVGAFAPRRLRIEGLDKYESASPNAPAQLFYALPNPADFAHKHVVIVGGDDTALRAVLQLADSGQTKSITLVHRRDVYQAAPELCAQVKTRIESAAVTFKVGQVTGFVEHNQRLTAASITDADGDTRSLRLDALVVLLGVSPKLGPVADWGLDMARKQVAVNTAEFSTSVPGIFAVGDINTYPGKKKLILCGFHEAALAAFGAANIVFPGQSTPLQYTTTSPRLHKLLGVDQTT